MTRLFRLLPLLLLVALPARAEDPAAFYAGRNVNVVIGYSVGGGYDLYARLLSRYLGKHLPGTPTVIPQSMPGAGSLKSIMYLSGVAPKDGTTFGTFGRSMVLEPLFSGAKFDPRKLNWIGSITQDTTLCVTSVSSGIATWNDLMTKGARMGGQAAGSDPDEGANILRHLFGSNLKLVTGYPGNNEMALALERGELDGFCGLSWSSLLGRHPDWLRDHKINLIVQASATGAANNIPAPQIFSKTDDPKKLAALKLIFSTQALARPYAAPPGVAPERLAALRRAFLATAADPDFLAEAKKLELDVDPVSGPDLEKAIAEMYAQPPEVISLAKEAVNN